MSAADSVGGESSSKGSIAHNPGGTTRNSLSLLLSCRKILHQRYLFSIIELMPNRSYLGEFELMILLTVINLGEEAYGVPVSRELERYRGRDVVVGSVYAALERLEAKGLVRSAIGEPTPERGGKAKRYFSVTREGLRQVQETRRVLSQLWQALPQLKRSVL